MEPTTFQFNNQTFTIDPTYVYKGAYLSHGFTPLMYLVMHSKELNCDEKINEYILSHKEELNIQNEEGFTALVLACLNLRDLSTPSIVRQLINAGCDLNLQDNWGNTALIMSCNNIKYRNMENIVKHLVTSGANVNIQNNSGCTALMVLLNNSTDSIIYDLTKLLLSHGANVNLRENEGHTALMIYSSCSFPMDNILIYENIIRRLINASSNLDLENKKGYNVLMKICNKNWLSFDIHKTIINKTNLSLIHSGISGFEVICKHQNQSVIEYCFTTQSHTETELIKCIRIGNHITFLLPLLAKIYLNKLIYFKAY